MMRLIREPVAPTAAKALLPEKRPTTTISVVLNISCRIYIAIMGMAKIKILLKKRPIAHINIMFSRCHKSIHFLYFHFKKTFGIEFFISRSILKDLMFYCGLYVSMLFDLDNALLYFSHHKINGNTGS